MDRQKGVGMDRSEVEEASFRVFEEGQKLFDGIDFVRVGKHQEIL